jgi:RNA polymerase sigma-70 factor (ECF subfamily)
VADPALRNSLSRADAWQGGWADRFVAPAIPRRTFGRPRPKVHIVAFTEIDRRLLDRCLGRKPRAWEDFVDRFMGLVVHVINFTAQSRSIRLSAEDRDDLAAEVFLAIIQDDFAILRHFRGESSLATYLTVVARRVVVRELLSRKSPASLGDGAAHLADGNGNGHVEQRISDRDEVERLLEELEGMEAEIVRLYHLEGKSYREISQETGVPENTIGPLLSRARSKMRQAGADPAAI